MPKLTLKATALAAAVLLAASSFMVGQAEARKRSVDGFVGGLIVGGAIAAIAAGAAAEEQKKKTRAKSVGTTKKQVTRPTKTGTPTKAESGEQATTSPVHEAKSPGAAVPLQDQRSVGTGPAQEAKSPSVVHPVQGGPPSAQDSTVRGATGQPLQSQ